MAQDKNRYIISQVLHPGGDLATDSNQINLNIDAEKVYVKIASEIQGGVEKYVPLSAIIQNYINYANNAQLTTVGTNIPANPRMEIWIDTDSTQFSPSTGSYGYNILKEHDGTITIGTWSGTNHHVGG